MAPTISNELKVSLNYFEFLRAGLGLEKVERDKITTDHLGEVVEALMKKFDGNFAALGFAPFGSQSKLTVVRVWIKFWSIGFCCIFY